MSRIKFYKYCLRLMKEGDFLEGKYGEYPLCCSAFQTQRKWTRLDLLDEGYEGQNVLVRGRVHIVRGKGNAAFLALRESAYTLQACAFKSDFIPKEMVRYISLTPHESIVDIYGRIVKP
jgi:aspartyl-tRNA synthetase